MAMKKVKCRLHGGFFTVPVKAGRVPVKCSSDNICTMHPAYRAAQATGVAKAVARTLNGAIPKPTQNRRTRTVKQDPAPDPVKPRRTRQKATEPPVVVQHNPSVPLAYEARRLLEPVGWKVTGKAGMDALEELGTDREGPWATVTGQRGTETLSLTWIAGKLTKQDYSMFPTDKPTVPGMPRKRLPFNPNELDDAGLVRAISGMKISWWNVMGQRRETATFPRRGDQRVKVERLMNGHGDQEARVVSFVDQDGTGFRAFNVNALFDAK
jgi:hypothetical protein